MTIILLLGTPEIQAKDLPPRLQTLLIRGPEANDNHHVCLKSRIDYRKRLSDSFSTWQQPEHSTEERSDCVDLVSQGSLHRVLIDNGVRFFQTSYGENDNPVCERWHIRPYALNNPFMGTIYTISRADGTWMESGYEYRMWAPGRMMMNMEANDTWYFTRPDCEEALRAMEE